MGILEHVWGVSREQDAVWAQVSGMDPERAGARPIMVWRAFMDESFKDDLFVLAGYVATAEEWAHFAKEWAPLARKFGRVDEKGRYYFHMTEHIERKDSSEYLPAFLNVILDAASLGIVWAMRLSDFRRAWDRAVIINAAGLVCPPAKGNLVDSLYLFALGWNLYGFHKILEESSGKINTVDFGGDTIDFIFDERSEKRAILSSWDEFKTTNDIDERWFGSDPRFEDDKVFIPLQAADFLAGAARKHLAKNQQRARELMDHISEGHSITLDELFPYKGRSKNIMHMITYPSEEDIFKQIKAMIEKRSPGLRVVDKNRLILARVPMSSS